MDTDLGVLIVGPGWVAGEHIKSYVANPNTEVRCIAGTIPEDRDRAAAYMEQYDFKADYTDNYEQAVAREDIDIVAVCTLNSLHYVQGLAAAQAGKHVFIEKPLCFTLEECRALCKAAGENNVKTMVGHVCHFYPAARTLWQFIREGAIGEIFYGESDYWHDIHGQWKVKAETAGSALLMGGVHSVDMVRWMMGEEREIKEVVAWSRGARWRPEFDYDPTVCLMMHYADGGIGKVATSLECNMPYVFHIHMCGTDGTVRNNGIYTRRYPGMKDFMSIPGDYMDDWNVAHHPFPEEVGYFVDCILKDEEPELSFQRAYKTYEVIFAAERSAREGGPVALPLA